MSRVFGIDEFSAAELARIRKKVDTLRGDGVKNGPDSITISNPQRRPSPVIVASSTGIKWGKAAADWVDGENTIEIVRTADFPNYDANTGEENITIFLYPYVDYEPHGLRLLEGDPIAYFPYPLDVVSGTAGVAMSNIPLQLNLDCSS